MVKGEERSRKMFGADTTSIKQDPCWCWCPRSSHSCHARPDRSTKNEVPPTLIFLIFKSFSKVSGKLFFFSLSPSPLTERYTCCFCCIAIVLLSSLRSIGVCPALLLIKVPKEVNRARLLFLSKLQQIRVKMLVSETKTERNYSPPPFYFE